MICYTQIYLLIFRSMKGKNMDIYGLLEKMTLEQKLAQMSQFISSIIDTDVSVEITGPGANFGLTGRETSEIGSCLGSGIASQLITLQDKHISEDPNKIPLIFMRDVIHGYSTIYPVPLGMGATWDEELLEECSKMAAKEAAVSGVRVTFSPMVDLVRDCRWGRNMESTGEDHWLNGRMGAAMVRGYQGDMSGKYNIACCVKHMAAYGACEGGRDYNTTDISEHTLREYYLPAYKACIDAGARMVMSSFNLLNGTPVAGNKWLLNDILRKEWGFDGVVISDWDSIYEMKAHGFAEDDKQAAEYAINATNDIEMMSACYLHNMEALINEGKVTIKQIDEAVLRILKLKEELGLFENPHGAASPEEEAKYCLCDEHRALARRAAEKAAVLLKNDGVLPINEGTKRIALIGPFGECGMIGAWACGGKEEQAVSVAEGLEKALPNAEITVCRGCEFEILAKPDTALEEEAVRAAENADAVILCLGEDKSMSGEGNSRADVSLPEAQKSLIRKVVAANKNTAVILFNGRPLALGDIIDDIPALVTMWHPGTEGGNAAANLLLGRVNFSGHLTMSFPYTTGQAPIYYNRMSSGRPKLNDDIDQPFCSRYIDCKNRPLFPFGYGLSYTSFEYSDVTLSTAKMARGEKMIASVTVKNTGKMSGETVVQLYIHDCFASLVRPIRELRGYKKISLEAGEEKTVSFEIDEDMLAFYTADGTYRAESGKFELWLTYDAESGKPVVFELE